MRTETVSAGDVIRWFCVDWEFFGEARVATNFHDEIFDICLDMKEAKEVNSGHTGVNIAFENSMRTDIQIIKEIKRRLSPIRKACERRQLENEIFQDATGGNFNVSNA